jgi:hypothetical protein
LGPSRRLLTSVYRRPLEAAALCVLFVAAAVACSGFTPPPRREGASSPTSQAPRDPSATAELEPKVVEAFEIREQYGLRADVAWVLQVAGDTRALVPEEYGIPLMPEELGDLLSRRWPNTLIVQLREYGQQFPDDFAMAYINQKASGAVVKFKANIDRHRAALATLPLDGPVVFEQADWSLTELNVFLAQVKAQQDWIRVD